MFVDVQYHGDMNALDKGAYKDLTAEIAERLVGLGGEDWDITQAGLAPFKVIARG
jgi:hypothetical protein